MKALFRICFILFFTQLIALPRFNTDEGNKNVSIPNQWKELLDPQTNQFWREGNHIPDAGFLILAKNPTLENAKFWLLRNEMKAKRLEEMLPLVEQAQRELVQKGLIEDRYNMVQKGRFLPRSKKTDTTNKPNLGSIDFFFIFSPDCPFCKKLAVTIQALPNVTPLQATASPLHNWEGLPKSQYATKGTTDTYVKDGKVPVLILHNRQSNNVQIIKGAATYEQILLAASNLITKRGSK